MSDTDCRIRRDLRCARVQLSTVQTERKDACRIHIGKERGAHTALRLLLCVIQ